MDKTESLTQLKDLVDLFSRNIAQYKSGKYDEYNTRSDYIDKFFKLLGWDMANVNERIEKNEERKNSRTEAQRTQSCCLLSYFLCAAVPLREFFFIIELNELTRIIIPITYCLFVNIRVYSMINSSSVRVGSHGSW